MKVAICWTSQIAKTDKEELEVPTSEKSEWTSPVLFPLSLSVICQYPNCFFSDYIFFWHLEHTVMHDFAFGKLEEFVASWIARFSASTTNAPVLVAVIIILFQMKQLILVFNKHLWYLMILILSTCWITLTYGKCYKSFIRKKQDSLWYFWLIHFSANALTARFQAWMCSNRADAAKNSISLPPSTEMLNLIFFWRDHKTIAAVGLNAIYVVILHSTVSQGIF